MENIAKMQNGREYDKTLIRVSDHDLPTVTDEEIGRQRKILQELESRPLIVDKSHLLTTRPLPKRAKASTSKVSLSKSAPPKRTPKSVLYTHTTTSGSGLNTNHVVSEKSASNIPTNSAVENKHGTQLLLALLTSVLGKVDGPSTTQPNIVSSKKGKEKETADDALADVLKVLLPFIPNAVVQASAASSEGDTPSAASTMTPAPLLGPKVDYRNGLPSKVTLPFSKPPLLFKTTEETFYHSRPGPTRPYDQHWATNVTEPTREHPKVREDAHPVPGGGWARGRNLVPRATSSTNSAPLAPSAQTEHVASDSAKCAAASAAQPDKENTPPSKTGRGLKRAITTVTENKGEECASNKPNDKKRKQNPAVQSNNDPGGSKRTTMGLTSRNKTNTFGVSGPTVAASSPSRSTASAMVARPVMAMSEPDYISRPPPIVATSLDLIGEPPRTPPRRDTSLDNDAGDSLFTPCAPDSELTPLSRGDTQYSANKPPSSPSVTRKKYHSSHTASGPSLTIDTGGSQECSETDSERHPVRTGWDLPPSSPPPPTSPISPRADLGSERDDHMDFELTLQSGQVDMENSSADGTFQDGGATIKHDCVSTAGADDGPSMMSFQTPDCSSDFDLLAANTDFDFGALDQAQEGAEGVELDIEELWSSLGPVIAQAQSDSSIPANNHASSHDEADFSCFDVGNDQLHVETEVQGGVDALKLAEDLKALFGGCVL
jgi:hypothetical protein